MTKASKRLILASQSPFRKQQLENFGLTFEAVSSEVDEDQLKSEISNPIELCKQLALKKALTVQEKYPEAYIIGADQLVHFEGQIIGKGGSPEKAVQQIEDMTEKFHELVTTVVLIAPDFSQKLHTDVTRIRLRSLPKSLIESYVAFDQTWICAGSYKIEGAGLLLIDEIETKDPSAIIGLPMITLTTWLLELNFEFFTKKI